MNLVDLHIHSNFSDGKLNPQEIIELAKKNYFSTISITDHDNLGAIGPAIEYGKRRGVEIIPGIEFSTDLNGREIHILGYFIDHNNRKLLDFVKTMRKSRVERLKVMIEKLNRMNIKIELSDVTELFPPDISFGRPHLAIAMIIKKAVKNYFEAFIKYIGDGKPACIKKKNPSALKIMKLINEMGGLSVLAHPGKYINDEGLFTLINEGLDGIEIIHPSHTSALRKHYSSIASQYFLLESGGSDFHGIVQSDFQNFGKYYVTQQVVNNMKVRLD